MPDTPQLTTVSERSPVPFAKVKQIADSFHELMSLRDKQQVTQAKLIRWAVQALTQTTQEAERRLERERRGKGTGRVYMHEPAKKVREDRALALLYLEWLATNLEGSEAPEPAGLSKVVREP